MKTKSFIPVLLVLALSAGTVTFARDNDKGHGRGNAFGHDKNDRGERRNDRDNDRRDERHDNGRHHGERGAGPEHSFYRGERLPVYYRSNQYVVSDWRGHRLSAPPRGYHWVQTGGDYVLIAVATGIILNMIINN